jgi:hypothetical protein
LRRCLSYANAEEVMLFPPNPLSVSCGL